MAKHLKRRVKPYTSSGIKTRNFLSNISYTGVKSEDFADNNFTFDTITLLTKNINPFVHFSMQKIETLYICCGMSALKRYFTNTSVKNDNFIYLNGKNVLYCKTKEIVLDYLNKRTSNIVRLKKCLQNDMKTIQFAYSRCFPEIYSLIDKRGINLKSEFLLTFKLWKDKKKFSTTSTNEKKSEDEQPLEKKIEEDEKLIKQLQEKKLKRKVPAEKNTALKEEAKRCCRSRPESTEKELWE